VTGTITNDDTPIINLSPDQKILEGETNPQNVTYTVTLSTSSTQTITVNYATADGTATAGLDYTSTNGTLTFAPGITTRTINIPILNDNLNEADETFTLTLTSPTNVNLGTKTSATTTITDTLTSSVTTTLPAGVENLTLTGTTAINGKGNDSNNILNGNSVNNTLTASAGNDILTGGDGVDTVDYSQLATSITLQAQGTVNKGSLGTDTVQAEVFIGNTAFANVINAASSTNNPINADLSQNSLTVFGLPSGDVTFTVVNFKNVTGSQADDIITGNGAANNLNGSAGDDILIASVGNDTLIGGDGVDIVDYGQLATKITLQAQGFVNKGVLGTDTVQAEVFIGNSDFANVIDAASSTNNSINADLSQNSLKVFGLPSGDVTFTVVNFQDVTGSQVNDIIAGNDLDNTLNGGAGADVLSGGTGNDSYYVDNAGDIVKENANEGTDTVFTTISYTLASNLENLTLLGTSAINATGNGLNNSLTGNNAVNTIDGGIGNDTLNGGGGNDILLGGVGADDLTGGIGNDLIYLGANDNAVDTVRYTAGHGIDTIYQFVRGMGGDKLNFTGIANFDVITSGTSTLVRVGDGIGGNTGFGTSQLLVTLSGTSGFTSANANLNLFGGNFLFN
jgi:Ca2+-binding RTX toxin-like protein